jgi:hypothetical protein
LSSWRRPRLEEVLRDVLEEALGEVLVSVLDMRKDDRGWDCGMGAPGFRVET